MSLYFSQELENFPFVLKDKVTIINTCALKGQLNIAQGNTLGRWDITNLRPERADKLKSVVNNSVALTGRRIEKHHITQGDALG